MAARISSIPKIVWADAFNVDGVHRDGVGLAEIIGVLDDAEPAALVAVLCNRPKGITYAHVVAEVTPRESALDLRYTHNPPDL